MKSQLHLVLLLLVVLFPVLVVASPTPRPANWAQPMLNSELGNWAKLDDKVYRSAQPDEDDFKMLGKFGIKAVINLREYHSDKDEADGTRITLYRFKLNASEITYDDLIKVMKVIKQQKGPILLHCWHGSDRTGAMAAAYRIVFQGWSKSAAIEELLKGGYGFHSIYHNIPELLNSLDEEKFRRDVQM